MTTAPQPAEFPPPPLPPELTPASLHAAAQGCRACDLHLGATQAVLGEGPPAARVMLVGEQPGDREDIQGRPFVGPAGGILDEALERAEIPRSAVYLTNAVKHFRNRQRGARRIHQRPGGWHVRACLPWLEAELTMIAPEVLVLLGATAAQALLGPRLRVRESRGRRIDSDRAPFVTVTAHPSSILRVSDHGQRHLAMEALVDDLRVVARWIARP